MVHVVHFPSSVASAGWEVPGVVAGVLADIWGGI